MVALPVRGQRFRNPDMREFILFVEEDRHQQEQLIFACAAAGLDQGAFGVIENDWTAIAYLEKARRNEPGAIMPSAIVARWKSSETEGLELLSQIRSDARFSKIRLILSSVNLSEDKRIYAQAVGCEDVLKHPQSTQEWLQLIGHVRSAIPEKNGALRSRTPGELSGGLYAEGAEKN